MLQEVTWHFEKWNTVAKLRHLQR